MGHLDQFAKRTFAIETPVATANAVQWHDPPEVPVADLRPDGYFAVVHHDKLAHLPQPWSAAKSVDDILVEIKMPGDHIDALAFERAQLRRQARQVQRLSKASTLTISDTALWFVAPILPEWLENRRKLTPVAPGCYGFEDTWFQALWIAANELPLRDELVPFLMARTGQALDEFVRAFAHRRPLSWLFDVLEYLPMSTAAQNEMLPLMVEPQDDPVLEARRQYIAQYIYDRSPWLRDKVKRESVAEGHSIGRKEGLAPLLHMIERRLRRRLNPRERDIFARQLDVLGPERLGDLVLDSTPQQLAAWLDLASIG